MNALRQGLPNLEKHLENIKLFGVTPIIAINKFKSDTKEEIQMIKDLAKIKNVRVAIANVWAKGGKGAIDLAKHVIEVAESSKSKV
jgi:formate--tetrahydrofolate ligase